MPRVSFGKGSSSGAKVICDENHGKLLIGVPISFEKDSKTVHGESDMVVATWHILDESGLGKHEVVEDDRVYAKFVMGSLKRNLGKENPVLGVLGKGDKQPGKSAPWVLDEPTEAQLELASEYWLANKPKLFGTLN